MPHFDWSINFGTVIAFGGMMFTFYKFHTANLKRFMKLEFQVRQMWGSFKKRFNIQENDFFEDEQ